MIPVRRVALIELYESHDECLYSQVRFLHEAGFAVHLIACDRLRPNVEMFVGVEEFHWVSFGRGAWSDLRALWSVRQLLESRAITTAVINTARGSRVRNLMLLPLPDVEFLGVAHIASKLAGGGTQRLLRRRMRKFYVLNDYIASALPADSGVDVRAFYPIYFPRFAPVEVEKAPEHFWVCVPGRIEFRKRSYRTLLDRIDYSALDDRVRFVLLGPAPDGDRDSDELKREVRERGVESRFTFFDRFLDVPTFHAHIEASDLVLPLVHPREPGFEEYLKYKISGAFNLAFGHAVPLFSERSFEEFDDFQVSGFFYDVESLTAAINELARARGRVSEKRRDIRSHPKFQFRAQQERYLSLLES